MFFCMLMRCSCVVFFSLVIRKRHKRGFTDSWDPQGAGCNKIEVKIFIVRASWFYFRIYQFSGYNKTNSNKMVTTHSEGFGYLD